jgi:hypothetical protein
MQVNADGRQAPTFHEIDGLSRSTLARRLGELAQRGVSAEDLSDLRALMADEAPLSAAEIDKLVAIEASPAENCEAWRSFFIETLTDHVVWGARPTGVVNESQGEWLIAMADRCPTLGAFGVLVNVLAEAHRVPLWFLAAVRARAARGAPGAEIALAAVA